MLYHALSEAISDPFIYTMSTVKSAFKSLKEKIENNSLKKIKPLNQSKKEEIRSLEEKNLMQKLLVNSLKKRLK